MLLLIQQCSKQMVEFLRQYDFQEVEMKETIGHFTLEVIGACAFGIKCDALSSEKSHFLQVAQKFDHLPNLKRVTLLLISVLVPQLLPYLKVSLINTESTDELVKILKSAKAERRSGDYKNNDFLQILIDFAKKEKMELENCKTKIELDDDIIEAQCLFFLIAGYETSSTLISFAIHVLATKPDMQDKLRSHIKELTEGKEITYELLSQLPYLEGFLLETLRVYPPVSKVERLCTRSYTLPGTSIKLDAGDAISIPIYGYHMDPNIYPEPHVFRPERFMGVRFAMLSAKTAMIALMKNFRFSICSKTVDPVKLDKKSMLIKPEMGSWVRVEPL